MKFSIYLNRLVFVMLFSSNQILIFPNISMNMYVVDELSHRVNSYKF